MKTAVFGVGIDTARYGHHVTFVDQDIRTATQAYHFKEDRRGYDKLKKNLEALARKNPDAVIRIKLLRIAYALWVKNESYSPEFEAKQKEEESPKEKSVAGSNLEVKPQRQGVTTTPSSVAPETETSKRKPLNYTILKTLLNIEEILGANRWKQRSSRGAQMRGACPLCNHQDERAFAANRSKNVDCCHRCDSKGNALDLLAKLSNTPIHEATWDWIDRTRITPPLL